MHLAEGLAACAAGNVTATLALATAGLDATEVRLVADPSPFFSTALELEAACGTIKVQTEHRASETNPKTGSDVAFS